MRKLWMAVVGAVVIAVAVAGIASAVNTYDVHLAATKPNAKGTATKPVPAQFKFGYRVDDSEDLRPQVIRQYRIVDEGLKAYPDAEPTCTFDQANANAPKHAAPCNKAVIGSGTIENEAGAPNDRTQKLACNVKLTLINIRTGDPRDKKTVSQVKNNGGMAIRIDTDPPACPIPVHEALAAPFYDVKIEGIPSTELRFKVPDTLAHPGGLDNSVVEVESTIRKETGRAEVKGGDERTVGYFSLVGRKGPDRTTRVTFVDESGVKKTATAKD
jgi:hypothetical protein